MHYREQLQERVRDITYEINYYINLLYIIPCMHTRNMFLNLIRDRLSMLDFLFGLLNSETGVTATGTTSNIPYTVPSGDMKSGIEKIIQGIAPSKLQNISILPGPNVNENQAILTMEQLSRYNGKNGNPAYVAVNGVVYDVTGIAAWAAATHFGLVAGRDLTEEFTSCHAGVNILSRLKAVGRLIG